MNVVSDVIDFLHMLAWFDRVLYIMKLSLNNNSLYAIIIIRSLHASCFYLLILCL